MAYDRTTAFGTTYGNLTDEDRQIAAQNSQATSIAAQRAALQEQIAAQSASQDKGIAANRESQGLELADRGVGRQHQIGMFDRGAGLQLNLDDRATKRTMDATDRAAAPALVLANLEKDKYAEGAEIRGLKTRAQADALRSFMEPGAGGAAPDRESMMYLAFGGNPGDLAQIRRQENRDKTAREDKFSDRDYAMGTELLRSTNPQARALGAALLGKSGGTGAFAGADSKMLEGALVPEQAPGAAVLSSPALGLAVDELAKTLVKGGGGDPTQALAAAQPMIEALVAKMREKGVPDEEARAYIKQELAKRLPESGFLSNPLASTADTFLPGTPYGDETNRSRIRQGVGIVD